MRGPPVAQVMTWRSLYLRLLRLPAQVAERDLGIGARRTEELAGALGEQAGQDRAERDTRC